MPTFATIATKINGFLMDVPHSNFAAHQQIQIYFANSPTSLNQTWTIVSHNDVPSVPDGYVIIYAGKDPSNHLCLDVPDSDATSGTLIQLYPVNGGGAGTKNQHWKLVPGGDNYVNIASRLNEKLVLDVVGDSGAPHTKIQIYNFGSGKPNQLWCLNPVS